MKISVTQNHIDNGEKENGAACPIALAVTEQCKPAPGRLVIVDEAELSLNGDLYPLPAEAIEFIDRFDNGLYVEPFEFELDEHGLAGVDYCGDCGFLHSAAKGCPKPDTEQP